jgi:ABC-2 type transport system permease protein
MMLWQKAWAESRVRFLIAFAVMAAATAGAVLFNESLRSYFAQRLTAFDTYSGFIYRIAFQGFARTLFLTFCFMLGMGGLLREREVGTAAFTLALPVSRLRLIVTRAAVGWLELAALACAPSLVVLSLSPVVGQSYPAGQALQFSMLWIAGGSAMFAVAFLASCVLAGEYTAFIVAWIVFFGHTVTTQYVRLTHPALNAYLFTLQEIMSGFRMPYFDPQTHLLIGPFPLAIVALLVAIACTLVGAAALYTSATDF